MGENTVHVWIDECLTMEKRCLFVNKAFSLALLATTCSCPGARSCFDVQTNALSSYSVMGGSAISAQTDFTSASVQVHSPLLPGVNEVVTVAECANEVTFTSANTDVSGENAVVFDVVFADPSVEVVSKPPLPPGSPPPPSPPPHPSDYVCSDTCAYPSDGDCDDGGQGAL